MTRTSPKTSGLAGLSVLGLLIFSACSSIPKTVEKPEVSLQSLGIEKASLTDATVLLKLAVRNPNPFKIPLDSLKYGLQLNGKPFAAGTTSSGPTVAANGDSEVTVPVRMSYWDLFSQFSDLMKNKANTYQITGSVKSGSHDFPFEKSGDVKLPSS